MVPVHARATRDGARRRHARNIGLYAAGAVLGVIGVGLIATADGTSVYVQGSELHVGGTVLRLISQTSTDAVYGGDAAFELSTTPNGLVHAVARWKQNGVVATVTCDESTATGTTTVRCRYSGIRGGFSTSTDVYDAASSVWRRTYDDGVRVDMAVPAGATAVPVAFPVGR